MHLKKEKFLTWLLPCFITLADKGPQVQALRQLDLVIVETDATFLWSVFHKSMFILVFLVRLRSTCTYVGALEPNVDVGVPTLGKEGSSVAGPSQLFRFLKVFFGYVHFVCFD